MYAAVFKRDFSTSKRKTLAKSGAALPDGSFPIANTSDLKNAVMAFGRAKDQAKAKAHIISRARALGAVSSLPESWNVKKEETMYTKVLKALFGEKLPVLKDAVVVKDEGDPAKGYSSVLKDSAASKKAWATRNAGKGGGGGGKTVGATGLSPKDYGKAVASLGKQIRSAEKAGAKAQAATPMHQHAHAEAAKVFQKNSFSYDMQEGNKGLGGVNMDKNAYAHMAKMAPKHGYTVTASAKTVADGVPSKIALHHKDGGRIDVTHNRDYGDFAAMDVTFTPSKTTMAPGVKAKKDQRSQLDRDLGLL